MIIKREGKDVNYQLSLLFLQIFKKRHTGDSNFTHDMCPTGPRGVGVKHVSRPSERVFRSGDFVVT